MFNHGNPNLSTLHVRLKHCEIESHGPFIDFTTWRKVSHSGPLYTRPSGMHIVAFLFTIFIVFTTTTARPALDVNLSTFKW